MPIQSLAFVGKHSQKTKKYGAILGRNFSVKSYPKYLGCIYIKNIRGAIVGHHLMEERACKKATKVTYENWRHYNSVIMVHNY